jgi:antibiotic biosynthesis monooxygenase (ABM) superfamily enzyme
MNPARRLRSHVLTTLLAWSAAYMVATALRGCAGSWLRTLPAWASTLVTSGVLAASMVNLAMPAIRSIIAPLRPSPAIRPQQHNE